MGVELPATTKMSAGLLSKRLDRALDAAQYFTELFPDHSEDATNASGEGVKAKAVDFASLPAWATGEKLGFSLGRQSLKEKVGLEEIERKERERTTGKTELPQNLDPFYALRTLALILGQEVDRGSKEAIFEDTESGHALFIQVVDVRKVADNTPLLLVHFRVDAKSPEGEFAFWKDASTTRLTRVTCPANRSLILLHRLLLLNSNRAAPGGNGHRSANLKTSIILPIGPIEKYDIAQLARATWSVMPFSVNPFGLFIGSVSLSGGGRAKYQTEGSKPVKKVEEEVPYNEHGDNPFLVKVQYNGSPFIMVYDRTRALETHLVRSDSPRVFDQIAALVREKGFRGMKIYVWAKRTADFELSLALDKIPSQNVP
ncbi:hypothetical protein FS837_003678 [Tulasnella sp. UAMH 9824]|nr:hypothetical protein FS837_003678 [Tulasnella sp. UAMH 9824]